MDDAARVRGVARDALADIAPESLRERLDDRLADASMTPGVLAVVCARAVEPEVTVERIADRAAGVQLIYEGLRLTRTLAREEPWGDVDASGLEADIEADLEIVAADIFVARGFYLLARTDAAERAVEVVRAFGREETARRSGEAGERTLEVDAFQLAVVAGTTVVDAEPSESLLTYAAELANACDGETLDPAATMFPETTVEQISSLSAERVSPSPTDG